MDQTGLDEKYIADCISELLELVGLRPSAPAWEYANMLRSGRVEECIEAMALYLRLPIKINLEYVSPDAVGEKQFHSRDMVKTDETGRGRDGITAQVLMPATLPMYGSEEFRSMTFRVKVGQNCADNPDSFVAIMAHELSHIVLNGLWYPDKDNEIKTDLTAMLLGFAEAMQHGRKVVRHRTTSVAGGRQTETTTITYGYLSDGLFAYAHREVMGLLNAGQAKVNELNRDAAHVRSSLDQLERELRVFAKGLELLDKRAVTRMRAEDARKLVSFHDAGFLDGIWRNVGSIRSHLEGIDLSDLQPYSNSGLADIGSKKLSVASLRADCDHLVSDMTENNHLVRKHLGLKQRASFKLGIGAWASLR